MSKPPLTLGLRRRAACAALVLLATAGAFATTAHAEDSLFYIGGSLGQANTKVGQIDFNKTDLGWKALVGTRPIPLLGAELAYVDLGKPSQTAGEFNQKATTKGLTAFGLIYLPVPLVDVYGKVGAAKLQATASSTFAICPGGPGCTPFSFNRKNTQPAYGVGAQMAWGPVAARAEYEHFQTNGGSPSLLSVGLIYKFL